MSLLRTLADKFKAAPFFSDATGKSLLMIDSNGNLGKANSGMFVSCSKTGALHVGTILRIRNITSVLISIRGYLGGRASLVWVSAYDPGTNARTSVAPIFRNNNYSYWINGDSEDNAALYVRSEYPSAEDFFGIVSLDGKIPIVETVSAVPADATRILND